MSDVADRIPPVDSAAIQSLESRPPESARQHRHGQ